MSDDLLGERNMSRIVPETLSITAEQLHEYVAAKQCLRNCEACGANTWEFPSMNGVPALFTMASARDVSFATWTFHFNCLNCGNTRFIGAGFVWSYFFEKGKKA
ncbi:hypothetical protein HX817_00920 [Pseudomonas sp. C6002]|uniref:hypothetical protein n=1 Tax=Pseudomonas sp. C6002 TaxID=2738814 RepID=UPI0015A01EDC|nr:hypothetical protein [Pseudomonas sp. C6002]NWA30082.1 hypothetical protein [Pseudomonas sp. C6002]